LRLLPVLPPVPVLLLVQELLQGLRPVQELPPVLRPLVQHRLLRPLQRLLHMLFHLL